MMTLMKNIKLHNYDNEDEDCYFNLMEELKCNDLIIFKFELS